jgi:hypothetical protein
MPATDRTAAQALIDCVLDPAPETRVAALAAVTQLTSGAASPGTALLVGYGVLTAISSFITEAANAVAATSALPSDASAAGPADMLAAGLSALLAIAEFVPASVPPQLMPVIAHHAASPVPSPAAAAPVSAATLPVALSRAAEALAAASSSAAQLVLLLIDEPSFDLAALTLPPEAPQNIPLAVALVEASHGCMELALTPLQELAGISLEGARQAALRPAALGDAVLAACNRLLPDAAGLELLSQQALAAITAASEGNDSGVALSRWRRTMTAAALACEQLANFIAEAEADAPVTVPECILSRAALLAISQPPEALFPVPDSQLAAFPSAESEVPVICRAFALAATRAAAVLQNATCRQAPAVLWPRISALAALAAVTAGAPFDKFGKFASAAEQLEALTSCVAAVGCPDLANAAALASLAAAQETPLLRPRARAAALAAARASAAAAVAPHLEVAPPCDISTLLPQHAISALRAIAGAATFIVVAAGAPQSRTSARLLVEALETLFTVFSEPVTRSILADAGAPTACSKKSVLGRLGQYMRSLEASGEDDAEQMHARARDVRDALPAWLQYVKM